MNNDISKLFKQSMEGKELTKQEGNFSYLLFGSVIPGVLPPYYNNSDFHLIFLMKGKYGLCFFSMEDYLSTTKRAFEEFLQKKGASKISNLIAFEKVEKEVEDKYASFHPDILNKMSDKEIDESVKYSFELHYRSLASTVFCESLNEDLVRDFHTKTKCKGDFNKFFLNASMPVFESFAVWLDKEIIKFVKEGKDDVYPVTWTIADYYVVPNLIETKKVIEKLILDRGGLKAIEKEQIKILEELKENKERLEKFKDDLGSEEKALLSFVQHSMYLRDARKRSIQKILTMICFATRETFRRIGLPSEDIVYAHGHDFIHDIYKKSTYSQMIAKRKNGIISYFAPSEYIIESGDIEKIKNKIFETFEDSSEKITEIKGNVAFKGLVKGIVKVISSEEEFDKFNAGEILVTSMTRPEFVPLMKRASAVITDEGGITCHAAIISRELKKPCITGTKNATRILKDGMEVEVNADEGTVRILEKRK